VIATHIVHRVDSRVEDNVTVYFSRRSVYRNFHKFQEGKIDYFLFSGVS
jgi:hypothetical protein